VYSEICESITKRQHLFNSTIDIDSNFLSYSAVLLCSSFAQNVTSGNGGNDHLLQMSSKSVPCSCEAEEIYLAWDETEIRTDKS